MQILNAYQDLDGESNWSHVYRDLAQLKYRHAFGLSVNNLDSFDDNTILDFCTGALQFFEIYFPGWKETLKQNRQQIFSAAQSDRQRNCELIHWIDNLIQIGWHLLS